MSLQDLIKGVSAADLTTFARSIPTPADFLLTSTVFPTLVTNEVKWRIKSNGRRVNTAKYRAYDSSVAFAERTAWETTREGLLPALGQKLIVGEQQQILLEQAHGADQDRLLELLFDDAERHIEAIRSRLELAAGDVLVDGRFTLDAATENGLSIEVDFGVPAGNMPVAPKPWSDPTSDPLADELGWLQYLDDLGAPEPELVITSKRAFSHLARNNAYRAAYYRSVNPSNTPTRTLTVAEVNAVRNDYGLPPVTLYKAQVNVDGTATKVLPDDRWIMLPPDRAKWGQTIYGVTAEALVLARGTNPEIVKEDAPGIVLTRGVQDDPVQIWTKGAAVAMPVLHTPDCHIVAKVL
ncbi:major capsid protein [Kitasatospora purpeofusca]|uniref:major capsid protein n=1 Tax=Kitasatospora purpeofusca TaxID=67352 RepID=UPI002A5A3F40|nr:major capsid protein [Kitasatospora purpeofusca]MDY0816088.1 major capsid protein [Kitasatospora purpeofusca]